MEFIRPLAKLKHSVQNLPELARSMQLVQRIWILSLSTLLSFCDT